MSNKMLVDATHPEETRVVVVRDKKVEDFDFEAASRKPLRGNIYLAKVTRVEPSLQAAFIEYGGNRHGFLAFSEIHPDYYQIPQADRAALLAEEREAVDEEEEDKPRKPRRSRSSRSRSKSAAAGDEADAKEAKADDEADTTAEATDAETAPDASAETETVAAAEASEGDAPAADASTEADAPAADASADADAPKADAAPEAETAPEPQAAPETEAAPAAEAEAEEAPKPKRRRRTTTKKSDDGLDVAVTEREVEDDTDAANGDSDDDTPPESMGNADVEDEIPDRRRRAAPRKNYKIQEVIKRRQILLVQVVKEERGTKGAALTTYLSLAGRYSVLMPNTDRGGGVSRKITDNTDRKRLKSLVSELEVPEGMGIILRTAGAARTKTEIKRDFEYLLRLWQSVRDLTLKSIAPALVYEEGNLVKRAIRDLYSKEIEEVLVSGDHAYREAKDFMKMLMPSHAKNVKPYREATPIFTAYAVEGQLDAMFSTQVTLPSKGYIVINQTEALVAIDVNSGRSTREANIEETAYKTNLEAADEVARQLRLRDLAGLIVIDFIDMDDKRHNRSVEKRLKDALKLDRSRIQVGRISSFGLMEMSRQRIRQGMVESSLVVCPHCQGQGMVRSTPSVALHCLRGLEEHLLKHADHHVTLNTSAAVALYILNQKRAHLKELEERFQLEIAVEAGEGLGGQHMTIVAGAEVDRVPGDVAPPTTQLSPDAVSADDEPRPLQAAPEAKNYTEDDEDGSGRSGRRRRRRRRRGGGGDEARAGDVSNDDADGEDDAEPEGARADGAEDGDDNGDEPRRRRRGRRGGRRHRREGNGEDESVAADATNGGEGSVKTIDIAEGPPSDGPVAANGSAPAPQVEPARAEADTNAEDEDKAAPPAEDAHGDTPTPEAEAEAASTAEASDAPSSAEAPEPDTGSEPAEQAEPTPEPAPEQKSESRRQRRVGWWQRRSFF